MAKSVYLISEAAKEVCVENHVLRYWEEELALPVKRNSQGHRYYTPEDISTFKRIKYLKEQGLQLRAIKLFLSRDGKLISYPAKDSTDKITTYCKETTHGGSPNKTVNGQIIEHPVISKENEPQEDRNEKAQKLQMILKVMIGETLREYDSSLKEDIKEEISEKVCSEVKDAVVKELDYQFRMQEERQDQEREERDKEILQRIEELLKKKNNAKKWKTSKEGKINLFPWKVKSAD